MAAKIGQTHGSYDKDVCDSGESAKKYLYDSPGQSLKKFADNQQKDSVKPYSGVESSKQHLKQKLNKPMDSGEGKGLMKNEGGSSTSNIHPKTSPAKPYSDKKKAPKRGAM